MFGLVDFDSGGGEGLGFLFFLKAVEVARYYVKISKSTRAGQGACARPTHVFAGLGAALKGLGKLF